MEDNRPTLAQYFVEQACPDNRFLEDLIMYKKNIYIQFFSKYSATFSQYRCQFIIRISKNRH